MWFVQAKVNCTHKGDSYTKSRIIEVNVNCKRKGEMHMWGKVYKKLNHTRKYKLYKQRLLYMKMYIL